MFFDKFSAICVICVIGAVLAGPAKAATVLHNASVVSNCGGAPDTSTVSLSPSAVTLSASDEGENCTASAGASAGEGTARVFSTVANPNLFNITEQNEGRATAGASLTYSYILMSDLGVVDPVAVSINLHASGTVSVVNNALFSDDGNLLNGGQRVSASLRASGSVSANGISQGFEEVVSVSANTGDGDLDSLSGDLTTPEVLLRPGQTGTITFGISGTTTGLLFGTRALAQASAMNSVSFATAGDVFNLPAGYFIEIDEPRIVNNRYTAPTLAAVPLPASGLLLLAAFAGFAFCGRKTS